MECSINTLRLIASGGPNLKCCIQTGHADEFCLFADHAFKIDEGAVIIDGVNRMEVSHIIRKLAFDTSPVLKEGGREVTEHSSSRLGQSTHGQLIPASSFQLSSMMP